MPILASVVREDSTGAEYAAVTAKLIATEARLGATTHFKPFFRGQNPTVAEVGFWAIWDWTILRLLRAEDFDGLAELLNNFQTQLELYQRRGIPGTTEIGIAPALAAMSVKSESDVAIRSPRNDAQERNTALLEDRDSAPGASEQIAQPTSQTNVPKEKGMSADDRISQYLTTVERSVGRLARPLNESSQYLLSCGFQRYDNPTANLGEIESDVGTIRAGLDDDHEVLTVWQLIHPLRDNVKKSADYLLALLTMNMGAKGAWFAINEVGEGRNIERWVVLVSRLAVPTLDKGDLALALESLFKLSKLYDEN